MNAGINRAGRGNHAKRAADNENIKHDVTDFEQTFGKGREDVNHIRGLGIDTMIRVGSDDLPIFDLDALESAGGNEVCRGRSEQQENEKQNISVRHAELHGGGECG